jgi:hypothetical protein
MKNTWVLIMGIILLPFFLPAGLVLIGLVLYKDYTSKYTKKVNYEKEEFGADVIEKSI